MRRTTRSKIQIPQLTWWGKKLFKRRRRSRGGRRGAKRTSTSKIQIPQLTWWGTNVILLAFEGSLHRNSMLRDGRPEDYPLGKRKEIRSLGGELGGKSNGVPFKRPRECPQGPFEARQDQTKRTDKKNRQYPTAGAFGSLQAREKNSKHIVNTQQLEPEDPSRPQTE